MGAVWRGTAVAANADGEGATGEHGPVDKDDAGIEVWQQRCRVRPIGALRSALFY